MRNWILSHLHRSLALFSIIMALIAPNAVQADTAKTDTHLGLSLRWEVVGNAVNAAYPNGRSRARFNITNNSSSALPADGWALYFNSIAGAQTAPANDSGDNTQIVSHVYGTLFKIRPAQGTPALAPGETLALEFDHPEIIVMSEKAPTGPYIVFDKSPSQGENFAHYQRLDVTRAKQVEGAPSNTRSMVTPEEIYARNAVIKDIAEQDLSPIFPNPISIEKATGALILTSRPTIIASSQLKREAAFARTLFAPFVGLKGAKNAPNIKLRLTKIPGQSSPEAYRIEITSKGIVIAGNAPKGVYYGLQSLRQLLPSSKQPNASINLGAMCITDAPRFAYRGLLLDVARNFQSKDQVFRMLDLMARYKLNKLHLHLSDDEGWRLQIKTLPELTSFGAKRGHSLDWHDRLPPAYGSGANSDDPHGSGYYTQSDYVEILRYANARHIEVIPEIEMPGHARAAVMAMRARYLTLKRKGVAHPDRYLLSDLSDKSVYRSAQLYSDNVINPGLASSYAFVDVVISELVALHRRSGVPLKTLQVGADELASGAWEGSGAALSFMKRKGIKSTEDLWDYYYDHVEKALAKNGVRMAGWEELGLRKVKIRGASGQIPNPHFVGHNLLLYVWNNLEGTQDLAYRLANAGYEVVLSPVTNLYFDMAYAEDSAEPGHNWAAYTDLEDVYGFDPFNMRGTDAVSNKAGLNDLGQANIVGLEATMFSETMRDPSRLDYMLMPRLLGLAERAWASEAYGSLDPSSGESKQLRLNDWSKFANQVGKHVLPRLDADLPQLAYRIAPVGLMVKEGKVFVNYQLPGFTLRYTINSTPPTQQDPQVNGPITAKGIITVAAFNRNGRSGRPMSIENK